MQLDRARRVFASHMAAARTRKLTAYEKAELTRARQALRRARRPAGLSKVNPKRKTRKNPRYGGIRGYVYYQDADGKFQQDFSPPYASSEKAKVQRWLRDAVTIIKRTGGKVHAARVDDYYGKTPGTNRRRKVRRTRKPVHNPGGLVRMGKLVEIRYQRDHGRQPGFYKHTFKVRPVIYYRKSDNSIWIKGGR